MTPVQWLAKDRKGKKMKKELPGRWLLDDGRVCEYRRSDVLSGVPSQSSLFDMFFWPLLINLPSLLILFSLMLFPSYMVSSIMEL